MANLLSNTTIGGYQSIHTGNIGSYAITSLSGYATQSWVQSQGYITGYTETDTLNSVTGRGNSTGNNIITSANVYASIFYDYNDNGYYLNPASSSNLRNIMVYPYASSWAEGIAFSMPSSSTWGGLRWRRERSNNDGNWYIGYTALDSTDDLVFGANNNGSQVDNIIRLTKSGTITLGGNTTINGVWQTNISTTGSWSKLSFTASNAWGDGITYGVLGASGGNEPGVMVYNMHATWAGSSSGAGIRMGRSGGVSSGAWYQVATMDSDEFMIAKNGSWSNGGLKITSDGILRYANTGYRYIWENGTWSINISGNAATANSATTATSVPWSGITGKPSGSTGLMQYGDFVNQVTFAGRTTTFHPSVIKTLLWGGNGTRYTVTDSTTGTYPQSGSTWVRTYELIDGSNSVYSSGNIYCGFWNNYPPANITVRVQNTSGTWYGPYQGSNIGVGYFEYWKIPCGGPNYIKKWEITFTPQAGLGVNLITVDIVIDNDEGIDQAPFVGRGGSSMYGDLNFSAGTINITGSSNKYLAIAPGNGYEAMVRYSGGSGSNWYVGKRMTGQLVDTGSFHFYSETASQTVAGIDTSGNLTTIGTVKGTAFIDYNNTSYYGDFASTSVMNAIRFGTSSNNATLSGNSDWGMRLSTDVGYIQFGPANSSHAHIYTDRNTFYFNKDILINGNSVVTTSTIGSLTAGSVTGLTLTSSANNLNPDNVTQNQLGYNTSVSLFGQTDGGLYSSAYSSSWIHQIYGDFRTGQIAIRGKNNGTWQAWRTVLDSSNYTSYSPSLTGSGASGTWGINVTGSAGSLSSMNISQFTNNSGYITSYSETDTLATVTGRGATTTNTITVNGLYSGPTYGKLFVGDVGHGSSYPGIAHQDHVTTTGYALLAGNNGNVYINKRDVAGSFIGFRRANSDMIVIDNDGNLGVNIGSPTAKVHIKGITSDSSYYSLLVQNSASEAILSVRNDKYVGIMTSSPAAALDIAQAGAGGSYNALFLRAGNPFNSTNSNQILFGYSAQTNYAHLIKTRHNSGNAIDNTMDFYVWKYGDAPSTSGGQHVMTLSGNGNMGVGKTAPTEKLDVDGTVNATGYKVNGTAGYNGTVTIIQASPNPPKTFTIVNGIITNVT